MVTGGFVTTAFGLRLSAHSPLPSLALASMAAATWALLALRRGPLAAALSEVEAALSRHWRLLVGAVATAALLTAATFHTASATGADASGYLSYAQLLTEGRLVRPEPLAAVAHWPDAPATLAPLGWRPSPVAGVQAPTYAIGVPLMLAPLRALGGDAAASWLFPCALALAVVAAAAMAHHLAGPAAAVLAAIWLASSPIALIQSMQVMSDVPATALWLICWWAAFTRQPFAAGLASALAILVRPNLAPLAIIPLAFLLTPANGRLRSAISFAAPVVGAALVVGSLQWIYFGSPLRSGYGTAEEIYARSNIAPNAALYAQWLTATHGPWLLTAPAALVLGARFAWLLAFAALLVGSYLLYAVFESWTYLRFLLPALAVAMVCVSALVTHLTRRLPSIARVLVLTSIVLALLAGHLGASLEHDVFRFADRQARGRVVGERLIATLPASAVIISAEQSGTMRFYTGRSILRWDLIAPEVMPDALAQLRRHGYQLWVVLDDWEEEAFRARFPDLAAQSIDARPAVESARGVAIRTRAWPVRE